MDLATFIILLAFLVILGCIVRVMCMVMCRNVPPEPTPRIRRRVVRRIRIDPPETSPTTRRDRQGNAFTIPDETSRENRYNDIFFIEPNSVEAARIRAQLEKDEKDLPSYEEVMRMANLSSPTAAPAANPYGSSSTPTTATAITASNSSVNTTDTILSVPAYTDVDLGGTSRAVTPPPYTPPTTSIVLPITTPLHTQQTSSTV